MPAKKGIKKSVVKKKQVASKVKTKKSVKSLPKVKLKSQSVLVRRSIMYVFVSSLILLFLVNAFPNVVSSIFYTSSINEAVLGESDKAKGKLSSEDTLDSEQLRPTKAAKTTTTINPTSGVMIKNRTQSNDTKSMTNTKTYDADGLKTTQSQLKDGKNGTDIKARTFGETGVDSSYQFKDKNGSVVMLKVREGESWSKLLYNEKNGMLLVKQKGNPVSTPSGIPTLETTPLVTPAVSVGVSPNTTPEISPVVTLDTTPKVTLEPTPLETANEDTETLAIKINDGGTFDLISQGVSAKTSLSVEVDGDEGTVFVEDTELNVNPDEIVEEATENEGLDTVEEITITKENGVTSYKVTGIDSQKFLGVFDVTIPKTLYYSVDTNAMISSSKTMIQNVIDAFSF